MNEYKNVKQDAAGWPEGLSEETKQWIIRQVVTLLRQSPMSTDDLVHSIGRAADRPDDFTVRYLDFTYCAVERAARVVAAPQWALRKHQHIDWSTGTIKVRDDY